MLLPAGMTAGEEAPADRPVPRIHAVFSVVLGSCSVRPDAGVRGMVATSARCGRRVREPELLGVTVSLVAGLGLSLAVYGLPERKQHLGVGGWLSRLTIGARLCGVGSAIR